MAELAKWVPMRWWGGPLDVSGSQKEKSFTAKSKETLEQWVDPSLLGLLEGTAINCLVVNWAAGTPADAEQQKALAPLLARGKTAGLAFVGMIAGPDQAAALESAKAAGLAAVMAEGEVSGGGLPVLPLAERAKTSWKAASPVFVAKDNVWPATSKPVGRGDALSGPTASPWIDSNAWFLRLARVMAPARTCWLAFDPPAPPEIVPLETYLRAVADGAALGGRWVVSLDEALRAELLAKTPRSVETWKSLTGALAFFEQHRDWTALDPVGAVGVISDFAGPNEMLGSELLNLIGRQNIPYRIIEKSRAESASLEGFKALVAVDEELPPPALRKKLLAFAAQGGVLMVSRSWKGEGGTPTGLKHPRLDLRTLGKGKFAVVTSDSPDPFMVARDIHVQLGRTFDLTRFYNIEAFISNYCAAKDGSKAVFHLTSFSQRLQDDRVTVWFRNRYRAARLFTADGAAPRSATLVGENGGVDVQIPGMGTYIAIELS